VLFKLKAYHNINVREPGEVDCEHEKLVNHKGHVTIDSKCKGSRKNKRKTTSNRRLRDYA